jgi:hypothetical protein
MAIPISLGIRVRAMTGFGLSFFRAFHTLAAAQQVDWLTSFGHSDIILLVLLHRHPSSRSDIDPVNSRERRNAWKHEGVWYSGVRMHKEARLNMFWTFHSQ